MYIQQQPVDPSELQRLLLQYEEVKAKETNALLAASHFELQRVAASCLAKSYKYKLRSLDANIDHYNLMKDRSAGIQHPLSYYNRHAGAGDE